MVFAPEPLQLPEECVGQTVDLVIVPGEFGQFPISYNPLETSQAAFNDDNDITVSVINNLNASVSQARVYAVVRNQDGRVVGGGYQITETIHSGSSVNITIPIAYLGSIDDLKITTFATLPYGVEFGQ